MFFTKRRVLTISVVFFILDIILFQHSDVHTGLCELGVVNAPVFACFEILSAYLITISIPIFLFSLITYKMKEVVFLSWRKFTFIYLFIYLFIVIVSPWRHADFSPFEKGVDGLFMLILYIVLSIRVIGRQYIKKDAHASVYSIVLLVLAFVIAFLIIDALI